MLKRRVFSLRFTVNCQTTDWRSVSRCKVILINVWHYSCGQNKENYFLSTSEEKWVASFVPSGSTACRHGQFGQNPILNPFCLQLLIPVLRYCSFFVSCSLLAVVHEMLRMNLLCHFVIVRRSIGHDVTVRCLSCCCHSCGAKLHLHLTTLWKSSQCCTYTYVFFFSAVQNSRVLFVQSDLCLQFTIIAHVNWVLSYHCTRCVCAVSDRNLDL